MKKNTKPLCEVTDRNPLLGKREFEFREVAVGSALPNQSKAVGYCSHEVMWLREVEKLSGIVVMNQDLRTVRRLCANRYPTVRCQDHTFRPLYRDAERHSSNHSKVNFLNS
jgi:hypothetical protein